MSFAVNADPQAEYHRRLAKWQERADRGRKLDRRLSLARGGVFVTGVLVVVLIYNSFPIAHSLALVAPAVFLAIMLFHARAIDQLRRAEHAIAYYEAGIARLENRWPGTGPAGERYADPDHVYAEDLDLFGRGSLFQLLCRARTRLGEDTLAAWLSYPADATTVGERQVAVEELRGALDLHEELALLDPELHDEIDQNQLRAWVREPSQPVSVRQRVSAVVISAASLSVIIAWLFFEGPIHLVLAVLIPQLLFMFGFRKQIWQVAATADKASKGLTTLAKVLAVIESRRFSSASLRQIRLRLETQGSPPSRRIFKLDKLMRALNNSLKNQFYAPVAFLLCLHLHLVHGIQKWRRRYGHCIDEWLDAVGAFEALSSLASHAQEHPCDVFPELIEPGPLFEGSQLAHPLLPESAAIRNDVSLSGETPLIMVSGSNMSGKSTLLRTIGTNAVLALAGAPVRAQRLRLSSLQVGSAMRVHDSLQDGKSLFYANLTRLRSIVDLSGKMPPLLFLLDEILQGTNSHDRRIGAEAVIRKLLGGGAIGLVTTHDLELTRIVESLDGRAVNVHFADRLVDGKMTFDYRVHPGVVERSNALELMRMMGLDV